MAYYIIRDGLISKRYFEVFMGLSKSEDMCDEKINFFDTFCRGSLRVPMGECAEHRYAGQMVFEWYGFGRSVD
jgi:hypothetical protein